MKPPSTCFKFSSETPILFYRRSTTGVSFIQIFDSRIIERLTLARMFPLHAPHSTQSHCNHIWYISNRMYLQVCLKHQIIACRCTGILVQDTRDVPTHSKNLQLSRRMLVDTSCGWRQRRRAHRIRYHFQC